MIGRLGKLCKRCGERFVPTGKFSEVCDKCKKKKPHWKKLRLLRDK